MNFRLKSTVDAVQWFEQGDHPEVTPIPEFYRDFFPVLAGCTGLLETPYSMTFVSSGDWIVDDDTVFKAVDFEKLYEEIK